MKNETPETEESLGAEEYRQKVLNGDFSDLPKAEAHLTVSIPDDVEKTARSRWRAGGKDGCLYDYIIDQVEFYFTFELSEELPEDDRGLARRDLEEGDNS